MADKAKTRVMTPVGRVNFPNLFKPIDTFDTGKETYQVTLAFDKKTNLADLEAAAKEAIRVKWGSKVPSKLRMPFLDGDTEAPDQPEMAGMVFIRLKTTRRPGVIDQQKLPIEADDPNGIYAGCYARATVNAAAYDTAGNKGVSFWLNNIQKVKDGDRIDGSKSADEDFDEIDDLDDSDRPGVEEGGDEDDFLK